MASARPPTQPGARIGPYELLRWLGEGGFAEVWLARLVRATPPSAEAEEAEDADPSPVAVKLLRRGRARDRRQQQMFLDEARLTSRIEHPNVAHVLAAGDDGGVPYLAMEYVDGGSLDMLLDANQARGATVPPEIALRLMANVCAGLHAAHELTIDGRPQHVIHRDVSPHNVLVTASGVPKLIDFGIAKARERLAEETTTGITKGKIAYMSPEQARGLELDRRADVWAVGMVLYELLEGRSALEGANEAVRLQRLVTRPVHPVFERTPASAVGIVERALAFYARDRQASAEELRRELEAAMDAAGLHATAADVARYLRAVMPARPASDEGPVRFGDLLGVRPSAPTISDVRIAATASVEEGSVVPGARSRGRLVGGVGAAAAAFVVVSLAATYGFGRRPDPPSLRVASPAASELAASVLPSSEPAGRAHAALAVPPAPSPTPSSPALTASARPRIPVVPTRSARPSPRASDDDLIE